MPWRRSQAAKCRSSAVSPALASISISARSASSSAAPVCCRSRPSRLASGPSARPAVSIAVNASGPIRPWPWMRSRVTPGVGSTSAWRRPTSRLNRVDLPTFGRPTIATVERHRAGARRGPPSAVGQKLGVLGQEVDRAAGGDRRDQHRPGQRPGGRGSRRCRATPTAPRRWSRRSAAGRRPGSARSRRSAPRPGRPDRSAAATG